MKQNNLKQYQAPRLIAYGNVAEITGTGSCWFGKTLGGPSDGWFKFLPIDISDCPTGDIS